MQPFYSESGKLARGRGLPGLPEGCCGPASWASVCACTVGMGRWTLRGAVCGRGAGTPAPVPAALWPCKASLWHMPPSISSFAEWVESAIPTSWGCCEEEEKPWGYSAQCWHLAGRVCFACSSPLFCLTH